ncbi:glycine--tRNA ligase [Spiroplasma endosymbiont of Aspidapion aeneum]|uniref:glycine--tRNA ligase n=1 Tax=Spiroplasma endosymbiont of Aspidapion aeneum TaxID=3066276 RepID=UPI00313CBB6C
MQNRKNNDILIAFLKNQGFVFQGSEIYGGLANSWDYGPLGAEMKNKLKNLWWDFFIKKNIHNVGLDSSIILNPNVWKTSGHIDNFNDPLIDCKNCKSRYRADKIIEEAFPEINVGGWTIQQQEKFILEKKIACQQCKKVDYTPIRQFQLMFKSYQGVIQDDSSIVYLRPETAQGIFINFKNTQRSLRKKLPFGIGQIGKSFRNEITPGNFIFRTREFEQMELEFFYDRNDETDWFSYWLLQIEHFLSVELKINKKNFKRRVHNKEELSHYSNKTIDIEYNYFHGIGELWGIASRTDFDLSRHQEASKQDLSYLDPITNKKSIPYVIEPSVGLERLLFAILTDAYCEETLEDKSTRIVLKLTKKIAPYYLAIMPLQKQQNEKAFDLYINLNREFDCIFDDTGNIGKRYRREDAIGTPYCITYDFDSDEDNCVTVRDRDTMKQERIKINDLVQYLKDNYK